MSEIVSIPLKRPIVGHKGAITEVKVRKPTFDEYMTLGDPFVVALAPDSKIPFMVEDKVALASYVKLLLVEPTDPLLLGQGGMELARDITRVVRGFFHSGAEADEASGT